MWKTKFGTCIYTSPSGYKVHQNAFYRWLTLGSHALQTVISRLNPQKPILYYLPALTFMAKHYPGSICLLGLGGAAIPCMFPDTPITAVDCSDEVIDIASRFFKINTLNQLTVVCDNAFDFVTQCASFSYAHLMIDLYNANHFPPECAHDAFFMSCKRILSEEGFLTINVANIKEHQTIFQLVRKHFNQTLVIPVKKSANLIILASKNTNKKFLINKVTETTALKRLMWIEGWGHVGYL